MSQGLNDIHQTNTPVMSYRCLNNKTWDMTFISGSCNEIMDCSPIELTTNKIPFGKLINGQDVKMVWENVQAALENRAPYQLTYHIKTPLNNEKILLEQGQGLFINDKLVELYGFISERESPINLIQCDDLKILIDTLKKELIQLTQQKLNNNIEYKLSMREIETLIYICKGMTMKEIGDQLMISPRTVEMHLNRTKSKLLCFRKSDLRKLFFKTATGKKIIAIL